jgi:hypothetical protein
MDYLCQHARQYLHMDVSIVTAGMHLYAKNPALTQTRPSTTAQSAGLQSWPLAPSLDS